MRVSNFKSIILLSLLLNIIDCNNNLYATDWNVVCIGDQSSSNIKDISYSFGMELYEDDETYVDGELDTCNNGMPYWDSSSPACGGDGSSNIIHYISNDECAEDSFLFKLGDQSGFSVIEYDSNDNLYKNSTIIVNNLPCISNEDAINITLGVYNWDDNSNFGITTAKGLTTKFQDDTIYDLTSDEITTLKDICKEPDPTALTDYTPYLEKIIVNTQTNSNIDKTLTTINTRDQKINDDLDSFTQSKNIDDILTINNDLDTFSTNYETTINDTYSTYSDIFGFSGYGSTPEAISFTMFDKEYKVFDPTLLDPYIVNIRDTFLIFAYLWGFIIVFRGI